MLYVSGLPCVLCFAFCLVRLLFLDLVLKPLLDLLSCLEHF